MFEQVNKIVGMGAPEEFVETLEGLANAHHEKVEVDVIRAYHFGARFIVEVGHPPCHPPLKGPKRSWGCLSADMLRASKGSCSGPLLQMVEETGFRQTPIQAASPIARMCAVGVPC